ncbi:MAG: hypothetical protein ED559_14060 [Phycisphaera sp.]|nr:MAG: hypothetical protein ED559_14060 [Phycisphaera sp.]
MAPGTPGARFRPFGKLKINSEGDIAFVAFLIEGEAGVNHTNRYGIWAYDHSENEVISVIRQGDSINVSNDPAVQDNRIVGDLFLFDFPIEMNERGQILVSGNIGTENGVLLFQLPGYDTCPADTNNDGQLTPADFTAWINAFNNNLPECDQNGDGACTPTDFTAWIANYNSGC